MFTFMCLYFTVTSVTLTITGDDRVLVYDGGALLLDNWNWYHAHTVTLSTSPCVLAVYAIDSGVQAGILAETSTGVVTDASWKCSTSPGLNWSRASFDDSAWSYARVIATNGDGRWSRISGISTQAKWIWADVTPATGNIYCRKRLC